MTIRALVSRQKNIRRFKLLGKTWMIFWTDITMLDTNSQII